MPAVPDPLPDDPAVQFRLLLDCVADFAVLLLDPEGRITVWGRGAEIFFGWTAAQAVGQPNTLIFTPEDRERGEPEKERDTAARDGRADDNRWHVRADGSRLWCEGTLTALRESDGTLRGFAKVVRDATERARLEAENRDRLREMRYLATHARCLLWHGTVHDTGLGAGAFHWETRVFDEEAAQEFFPLDIREGERYTDAWYRCRLPEGRALTDRLSFEALNAGLPCYGAEFGCEGADGRVRWFSEEVYVGASSSGEWRHWEVVGVALDITERKAAEDDLRRERAYLRAVLEQMPSGLSIAEAHSGRILLHNDAAVRLLRHPMRATEDFTAYAQYGAVHPDGTPYQAEEYPTARAAVRGERVIAEEMRYRRGDGTFTWFSVNSAPMHDEEGHVVAAITTFQDIGARKEAEGRLQRAYDRDHRIAETLQQSLLLSPSIDSLPGVRVRPFYVPALSEAAVGGDFYDAFPLDGGRVALVVGDASGKGVEAAARTAEVKYAVRAFLSEHPHPARALERVNEFLCGVQRRAAEADPEAAITAAFVALALAVIDPSSGEVLFAVAGIEPPLVLRARCDAEPVEGSGLPLGIDPAAEYEVMSRRLTPRDTLLLATDGLTEAREVAPDGARGAFLGYEGFARLAEQACPAPELDAMGRAILDGARAFTGGSLQDDVCLLLARLK